MKMARCKVKFCGMTNLDDCLAAVDLGVDYLGFVFYKRSARYVTPHAAAAMTKRIAGRAKTVGVFVEETPEEVRGLLDLCGLDYAQVYTRMKGITNTISVSRIKDTAPDADEGGLVLFDSYSEGFGGSGASFDIGLLEGHPALARAFIAGGIGEHNVCSALSLNPYGIDLVSSIEAEKGKKDRQKMKNLMNTVRSFEP
jgi:phosphoribosylanthranilate isomerase